MNINHMDDLAVAELSELEQLQGYYKDMIRQARRSGNDTQNFEIELNYVQRELHVREQREMYAENLRQSGFHFDIGI